ncbi:MAG: ribosome maturation factor RimM [Spirochaetota bacterium]
MSGSDQFLRIARITGVHGLNGRLKLEVVTDFIERFSPGSKLYIKMGDHYQPFLCAEFTGISKTPLLKLENINDRDVALSFKGKELYTTISEAEKTRHQLGDDEFYFYDLIGCIVYMENKIFGKVVDIMEIGENSILVLNDKKGKEFLMPFNDSMVDTGNISKSRIDIKPIDGLFELEE